MSRDVQGWSRFGFTVRLSTRSAAQYLYLAVTLAAIFPFLVNFGLFVNYGAGSVIYPFELDYGEGPILGQANSLFYGLSIYESIQTYPYVVTNYPPFFHVVVNGVRVVLGDALIAGRATSLASSVITALLIFLLIYKSTDLTHAHSSRLVGATLGSLAFFSFGPVFRWAPLMRVDSLAVMLSVLGVFLFLQSREHPSLVYLSGVIFAVAIFTKQNSVAAPSACLFVSGLSRPSAAVKLLGTMATLVLAAGAYLTYVTEGEFMLHTVTYNVNEFRIERAYTLVSNTLWTHKYYLLVAVTFIGLTVWKKRDVIRNCSTLRAYSESNVGTFSFLLFTAYFITSFLVSLTIGKVGSSVNYFTEWMAAWSVITGVAIVYAGSHVLSDKSRAPWTVGVIVAGGLAALLVWQLYVARARWNYVPTEDARRDAEAVMELIRRAPGPVLSEDMTLLVKAGKQILFQSFIMTQLHEQGLWRQEAVLEKIRTKHFDLIIACGDRRRPNAFIEERTTPEIENAILAFYPNTHDVGKYRIYAPDDGAQ